MHPYLYLNDDDKDYFYKLMQTEYNLQPAIVEKDIWVCIMLDYLFNKSPWSEHLCFKGGTSLSKAYHIIERFSEDIDIILDWRLLGYSVNEPWQERSKSKQDKFVKEMNQKTIDLLKNEFMPKMNKDLTHLAGITNSIMMPEMENKSGPLLIFKYPRMFSSFSILPEIRLEIGSLAAWGKMDKKEITTLGNEYNTEIFPNSSIFVPTISLERAFWEKATIAHKEANRPGGSSLPARYVRHYYDLHCMYWASDFNNFIGDTTTLNNVIEFNEKFYLCNWANYNDALEGKLKFMPSDAHIDELKNDYESMKQMIYGEKPDFEKIMSSLSLLEQDVNYMINKLQMKDER